MAEFVYRPWGEYIVTDTGERHQTKRLTFEPGKMTSVQRHRHRSEYWIVAKGAAEFESGPTPDGMTKQTLYEGGFSFIPVGTYHRLSNPGKIPLEVIEVQLGSYFGEDDIERVRDRY